MKIIPFDQLLKESGIELPVQPVGFYIEDTNKTNVAMCYGIYTISESKAQLLAHILNNFEGMRKVLEDLSQGDCYYRDPDNCDDCPPCRMRNALTAANNVKVEE